uniref:Uncharacterized protein n=1 Tax=Arundo donax TaxID=35708 RepID=A0A0A8YFV8_ARUDO
MYPSDMERPTKFWSKGLTSKLITQQKCCFLPAQKETHCTNYKEHVEFFIITDVGE